MQMLQNITGQGLRPHSYTHTEQWYAYLCMSSIRAIMFQDSRTVTHQSENSKKVIEKT